MELGISEECNGSVGKVLESVSNALSSDYMICQCNDRISVVGFQTLAHSSKPV